MAIDSEKQVSPSDPSIVRIVDNIKKSDSDSWSYRALELSNEMLVVLISHPNIDKAAAALDVTTGSLADPVETPGIAHFLEHMLFMGSEKYPIENEYSKLIEGNGGYSNAFTSGDHTNYYFDIKPNLLPQALDVFAQFFISPLFAPSSTDRELQAVNSEYEGNLSKDLWRFSQLDKSTSDPQHPYSKFSIGSTKSLRTIPNQNGIDIRQVLLEFHKNEYSANRMSLAVLGKQPLDELQTIVVNIFKEVPNKKLKNHIYPPDPYGESRQKTICYVVPVKENRRLTISWVVPDFKDLYYCNPNSYLSHLIGHEGNGSMLSYLKKQGLALELASGEKNSSPGFCFFTIDIDLTVEGLNRWEQVLYIVYQYMTMLRKEGPKEWIFDECKNLNAMHFQFKEKERPDDFVSNLSGRMRDYPLIECLSGDYEMREFRPKLINEVLDEYLIPSKMRVYLISKDFESIATEQEEWFGTQYKLDKIPEELIEKCQNCDVISELHLPSTNEFIPTDFHLFSKEKHMPRPQLPIKIKENEFCRVFYAEDSFYKLPKAYTYFEFRNPIVNTDPIHFNLNTIYSELIDDALMEISYPAQLGGLHYEILPTHYGIQMTIHGYNHKIRELLETVVYHMINIKIDVQRFEIIREKIKRSLQNFRREVPYQMAHTGITYLTAEYQWNKDELLSCIDGITIHDIQSFIPRFLTRLFIDSLIYGNITKDQAIEYIATIERKCQEKDYYQPIFPAMWFNQRELILPEGCNYAYTMLNDAHKISGIEVYLQCFQQTLENNSLLDLFCHLVDERCFDQLRTKEQLGYIVNASARRSRGVQGFRIIVQSAYNLEYVHKRIEIFIDSIKDYLLEMSEESFKQQRDGCIVKILEIPKKLRTQASKFWTEINTHQFCFNRPILEAEFIQKLNLTDVIRFYDQYISPRSAFRRKLTVYVEPSPIALRASSTGSRETSPPTSDEASSETETSTEGITLIEDRPNDIRLANIEWIDNIHVWKSKLACYPLAQAYEKVDIPVLCKL